MAEDTHQKGLNLFKDSDTPIRKLPYDCLVEIFLRCSHTETLLELSRVCHSWRKIALQPSVVSIFRYLLIISKQSKS